MRLNYRLFLVPLCLFLSAGSIAQTNSNFTTQKDPKMSVLDQLDPIAFQESMRTLWEEHIVYTRFYLISATESLGDKDVVLQRLLKNQKDIGDSVKVFYGDAAGDQLTALLTEHIKIAGELISDLILNKSTEANAASVNWYKNADDIATFLYNANSEKWPLADLKAMMKEHLDDTAVEVKAQIAKDYVGSLTAFGTIQAEILKMADFLSMGIMKQFPDMFQPYP